MSKIELKSMNGGIIPEGLNYNSIKKALRQNIFRGLPKHWTSVGIHKHGAEYKVNRYRVIHRVVKQGFMHPLLKFIGKRLGRFLIKDLDELPNTWFNVMLRMMYDNYQKALDDMWTLQFMPEYLKKHKTKEEYLQNRYKTRSHKGRKLIFDIWMTEVMEDTIDREAFNFWMMRNTHSMMEHFGVSKKQRDKVPRPGDFPIYKASTNVNPTYFLNNIHRKTWSPKNEDN